MCRSESKNYIFHLKNSVLNDFYILKNLTYLLFNKLNIMYLNLILMTLKKLHIELRTVFKNILQ